ncbi:DUF1003 domain-containing protein [Sphingomonas gilva]|uniref:DUF1003 domain-containing protein n=1 Tax=Sphingomonas gilva TaxID=2305907 RepID=A0A396RMA7_9SPHN|nr:DUF1003 domain-containing protein [Sphingomonas gilva]RHW17544.1 DUF1003 domain-containing protein [Sphingomonas gilva]
MTGEAEPPPGAMSETLRENIATLAARRRAETDQASFSERIAGAITRFTGSMTFVAIHLVVFGGWIVANLGWLPGVPPFDPSFVTLAMVASVEAIFLSTFVLISQNRMMRAADRRADLDLHINLLAEHELTKVGDLLARIAERLEVHRGGESYDEIRQIVRPHTVLDAIDAAEEGAAKT